MNDKAKTSPRAAQTVPPDAPTRKHSIVNPDDPALRYVSVVGDTYTILLSGAELTKEMLSKAAASYLDGHDPRDPLASLLHGDLAGRPPIPLHAGTSEVLLDDTRRYAESSRAAGAEVVAHVWEGMTHVFPSSVPTLEAAEKALSHLATFLDESFEKRTAHGRG